LAHPNHDVIFMVMKNKETLEEAAFHYSKHKINKNTSLLDFTNGAKWQAERMYSEAIKFGKWLDENIQQREYYPMSTMTMEELFEQFKKK
jgi:hypothetical protein